MYPNHAPNGQGPPGWTSQSPNPQHPHGTYPPPSSQSAQPYPQAPTNGSYPPPASQSAQPYPPPPTNGTYPPPTSQSAQPYPHSPANGAYPPPTNGSYPPPPGQHPPANGGYPPPAGGYYSHHLPPIAQEPRPDMMHPGYRPPPPYDMYGRGPPPSHHYAHPAPQPAPRQRTAIACRYCRRRKIRCSGFEASEDGRCTNCVRFSQECIFTPVSAQTQAFVPAHTVTRWGNGQPPALYGAYGQPLPPQHAQGHAPPPPPQGQQGHSGYPLPSPTASSNSSYHLSGAQPQPQPYYNTAPGSQAQPPRRSSPQSSNLSYDPNRASSSPHGSAAPSTPGAAAYAQSQFSNGQRPDGRTPPPTSQPAGPRSSMRIDNLVSGETDGASRSSTDTNMLSALNRRGVQ